MNHLANISCSAKELPALIENLAQRARIFSPGKPIAGMSVPVPSDAAAMGQWIESLTGRAGLQAEQEHLSYPGFRNAISKSAPLVLWVADAAEPSFIVVLAAAGKILSALGRDLKSVQLNSDVLRDFLFRRQRSVILPEIERLLQYAEVSNRRRRSSTQILLNERLADARMAGCWTLRLHAGADVWQHVRSQRLPGRFCRLMASYAAGYLLWLLSWCVLGFSVLQGRFEGGWIGAWTLLLVTMVPLRLLATWMQGVTATGAGWVCRQKLLHGILQLDRDHMRSSGIGHFFGRALELEAIETFGFSGGASGMVALIELAAALLLLGIGASPMLELLVSAGWIAIVFALLLCYLRRRRQWTGLRLEMTYGLIERIIGHRTRLVQEMPDHWHAGEDEALADYLAFSKQLDLIAAILNGFVARGFVLLSLFALTPAIMNGGNTSSLAITLGGALIGSEALRKLVSSIMQLSDTSIAWQRIRPLLAADSGSLAAVENFYPAFGPPDGTRSPGKLIEMREVCFQHRGRPQLVLQRCQLSIFAGDKLLLEGSSGSGKSSLVALLAGLCPPDSGLLFLNGLDQQTLGMNSWRRKIAMAPQFHENYVFSATFAFNLLMGRRWPAPPELMLEAEALCQKLGLAELLRRMPAGLMQMVGETGWQLSHGERSRLFIARALLQNAEMVVLDESFAALDPDNLRHCVECVLNHSKTLLVVAHP